MAAIIAVLELPPRFSRKSHVKTESLYGIKSAFLDFLDFDAWNTKDGYQNVYKYLYFNIISILMKMTLMQINGILMINSPTVYSMTKWQ